MSNAERSQAAIPFDDPNVDDGSLVDVTSVELDEDIKELDTNENREFLKSVHEKITRWFDSFWDVGQDLSQVKRCKLFKLLGYKNFEEYCKTELDFNRRKSYDLAYTFEYFDNKLRSTLSHKPVVYEEIVKHVKNMGWSKASEIAQQGPISAENADQFLESIKPNDKGEYPTRTALKETIKEEFSQLDEQDQIELEAENEIKTSRLSFSLTPPQLRDWQTACKVIGKEDGKNKNEALSLISRDFATTYQASQGGKYEGPEFFSNWERQLGLDIIAVDRQTGKVVYGDDSLEKIKT